jgi:hypothetical protein
MNEAFSRAIVDAQLADEGWDRPNSNRVWYEYVLLPLRRHHP